MAEAQFSLGRMRLLEGRFAEGWEGYEWRLRTTRAKTAVVAEAAAALAERAAIKLPQ
jgi:hypothetical protein